MNALYDAPVDAEGKPLFADVPVRERVLMRADEKALVQYGCDGERFAVSVRDAFGSLRKETILRYLDKCLHATRDNGEQIDRKAGGAGLGLYLICNSASEVGFHIFAGSATEVICGFDLSAARAQLRTLGVFEERHRRRARTDRPHAQSGHDHPDATRPPPRGSRRRRAPTPRAGVLLPVMMTFAVLLLLFAIALAALPYLRRPAAASLRIETDPPGALVYVDGRCARHRAARRSTPRPAAPTRCAPSSRLPRRRAAGHRRRRRRRTRAAAPRSARRHARHRDRPGRRARPPRRQGDGQADAGGARAGAKAALTLTLRKEGFVDSSVKTTAPAPGERALYHTALAARGLGGAAHRRHRAAARQRQRRRAGAGATRAVARHLRRARARATRSRRPRPASSTRAPRSPSPAVSTGVCSSRSSKAATIALKTNVAAKVLLDDKPIGTAPLLPVGVTPGEHTLALRGKSHEPRLFHEGFRREGAYTRGASRVRMPTTRSPVTSASGRSPINGRMQSSCGAGSRSARLAPCCWGLPGPLERVSPP